ncbi:MAG TPA: DUF429 domain-containing protein [Rubricoccaceae bacterium]
MTLGGVDGCRAGWVVATDDGERLAVFVVPTFQDVLTCVSDLVAVDIPIGLPEAGPRDADRLARRASGRPSSVFPVPVRGVLALATHAEASARHRAIDGRGMTRQAFGILPKIAEVAAVLRADLAAARRTFEVHPEVTFAALAGAPLAHAKKTREGRAERLALLAGVFGDAPERLAPPLPRSAVAPDDVLDAFAALWTARRIAAGVARSLPETPPLDAHGLPMAIRF